MKKVLSLVFLIPVIVLGTLFFYGGDFLGQQAPKNPDVILSKLADGEVAYRPNEKSAVLKQFTRWVNYKTEEAWAGIDISFRSVASGFLMDQAPFEFTAPKTAKGKATFYNNNRWDNIDKKGIVAPPLSLDISAENVANVKAVQESPTTIAYPNAYSYGDLVYRMSFGKGPQAEKLIRINSNPSFVGSVQESFIFQFSGPVDIEAGDRKNRVRWGQELRMATNKDVAVKASGVSERRGIGFKDFYIWDSNPDRPKREMVEVSFDRVGNNKYKLTKIIPASFFTADVVYPVFTDSVNRYFPEDADHGTLVDGRIQHDNLGAGTWTQARDSTGGTSAPDTETNGTCAEAREVSGASGHYSVTRCWFVFPTGDSISATDDIISAKLGFKVGTVNDEDNDDLDFVVVVLVNPASTATLATSDINDVTDMAGANPFTTAVELRDMSDYSSSSASYTDYTNIVTTAYTEIEINATGTPNIAKGAGNFTKFGLAEGHDAYNIPLQNDTKNRLDIDFAEGTNPPYLEVEFASGTPAGSSSPTFDPVQALPFYNDY